MPNMNSVDFRPEDWIALDSDRLIALGQSVEHYREVLIALIRQHLQHIKQSDPFILQDFSYHILQVGSVEQTAPYLAKFIAKCQKLPVQKLIQLGRDVHLAKWILLDVSSHLDRFEIGVAFAKKYPELQDSIALDWSCFCENTPLTHQEKRVLSFALTALNDMPAFKQIAINNHFSQAILPANYAQMQPTQSGAGKLLCTLGAIGGMVFYRQAIVSAISSFAGPFSAGCFFAFAYHICVTKPPAPQETASHKAQLKAGQ